MTAGEANPVLPSGCWRFGGRWRRSVGGWQWVGAELGLLCKGEGKEKLSPLLPQSSAKRDFRLFTAALLRSHRPQREKGGAGKELLHPNRPQGCTSVGFAPPVPISPPPPALCSPLTGTQIPCSPRVQLQFCPCILRRPQDGQLGFGGGAGGTPR